MTFDVDSMIQALDVEQVLSEIGIDIDRRKNKNGWELYFDCINAGHDDDKKNMSMAEVGQYKGLFYCWKCKLRGNIIQVIQYFLNLDFRQCLDWIQNRTGVGEILGIEALKYKIKKEKLNYGHVQRSEELPIFDLPSDYARCGDGFDITVEAEAFLHTRRIGKGSWRKFQIGVSNHQQIGYSITVPIFSGDRIVSIFYCQPKSGGEKRYPTGAPQGEILFNYDECFKVGRYVLVESILDVILLDSLNLGPAASCFTNMVSDAQIDLLKLIQNGSIFPDRDSKYGWELVNRMVRGLDKSLYLILPPLGKDPGDCEDWEIVDSYAQKQRYCDWEVHAYLSNAPDPQGNVIGLKKK